MSRTLIKNGFLLTLDGRLGAIADGDILIERDRIAAVGPGLKATDAEVINARGMIVFPGLVNSHIHTWETSLRGIGADWVGSRDYFANMHGNLAQRFTAHDNQVANLLGSLAQITMALATLGPDWGTYEVAEADIRLAREYDIINSAHTFGRKGKRKTPDGMWRLQKAGLLGPDHNVVHGNCFEDDELKMIIDAGCSTSATVQAEMLNCESPALLGRVAKLGGIPAIGTDVDAYFGASMLTEMRRAFLHQRELDNRTLFAQGRYPAEHHSTTTREALKWATLGGARALRLDHKIGALTPGKQADIVLMRVDELNVFPAMPHGDPAHAVVMDAETANLDTVFIAGRIAKRHGKLTFPTDRLERAKGDVLASRERIMAAGNYIYKPASQGAWP